MFLEKKEGMVESGVADERKKPVGGTNFFSSRLGRLSVRS